MVTQGDAQHGPASHWSAANPVPTIHKFIENLDQNKKERDQRIDEQVKQRKENDQAEAKPFDEEVEAQHQEKGVRKVTDPVTRKEIEIQDVQKIYLHEANDPKVKNLS